MQAIRPAASMPFLRQDLVDQASLVLVTQWRTALSFALSVSISQVPVPPCSAEDQTQSFMC